jgi:hypothetical protein
METDTIDVNEINREGYTPLNLAYINKDLDLIDYLIQRGAKRDVDQSKINNKSMSSFFYKNMVSPRNRKIAMMFHDDKYDLEHSLRFHELVDAVSFNDYEMLDKLLRMDIDCNMKTWTNSSILSYVNDKEVLVKLLKKGLIITNDDLKKYVLSLNLMVTLVRIGYNPIFFEPTVSTTFTEDLKKERQLYKKRIRNRLDVIFKICPTDCVNLMMEWF